MLACARRYNLLASGPAAVAALFVTAFLLAAPPVHAQAQRPSWKGAVAVEEPAVAENFAANTTCVSVNRSISRRVAAIRGLRKQNEDDRNAPAATVSGTLQQLMGKPYVSRATKRRLESEKKELLVARELNMVLASLGCPEVDVEAELNKEPLPPSSVSTTQTQEWAPVQ